MQEEILDVNEENPTHDTIDSKPFTELKGGFDPDSARKHQQQYNLENGHNNERNKCSEIEPGVYRVNGALTKDDVEKINAIKENTTLVLDNTAGLSSELISQIETDTVFFSIKGGLDYEKIKKYNTDEYKERTKMSPKGLEKVIRYFERIEDDIEPEWTDLQKCMYAYNALATDMNYSYNEYNVDRKYDQLVSGATIVRSLNGVMYGELACAGFALTFKEMMDRMGIECSYQNVPHTHDFNVVSIDGKNYGVDVTWDNSKAHRENGDDCGFANFGQNEDFYSKPGHRVAMKDRLQLSVFSREEIDYNRSVIAPRIAMRKKGPEKSFGDLSSTERGEYLPIKKEELQANAECGDYVKLLSVLTTTGVLSDRNSELSQILQQRKAFVLDLVGGYFYYAETETGKEDFKQLEELSNAKKYNDEYSESELDSCIISLNFQLEHVMSNYVRSLYESANDILKDFDTNDANVIRRTDKYTKLITIRNARNYLIKNGYDTEGVDDVCEKIDNVLNKDINNDFEETESDNRKNHLDYLGAVLENELIDALQKIKNNGMSREEFAVNFGDSEVWAERFVKNDLSGYNVSKTEIKGLIDDIFKKYMER